MLTRTHFPDTTSQEPTLTKAAVNALSSPSKKPLHPVDHPRSLSHNQKERRPRERMHSALLVLPREIRDKVYEHAFGDETRGFIHNLCGVAAYKQPTRRTLDVPGLLGLPKWPLNCKLICTEAMDLFGRTRSFEGFPQEVFLQLDPGWEFLDIQAISITKVIESAGSPAPNLLTFNFNVMRTIYLQPWVCEWKLCVDCIIRRRYVEATTAFLALVRAFDSQGLCLQTVWDMWWYEDKRLSAKSWDKDEVKMFDFLEDRWDGRFRKVHITLPCRTMDEDAAHNRTKFAEKFSRRLVGDSGGKVSLEWGEEEPGTFRGQLCRIRSLVVQRKV
ncbi:hypothetical protein CC86DRAFT_376869 [Ophiobolus disseminans]|uniref:F-box domain-containing protein n=1 Tax=Ophiobolus disseminans TaxID=1469910 RepID=A0A6A7AKS2_9PLEO|nr:hypothetical protein CC86DRAFT_376869 [Ophiobolus disseminans]